MCWARRGVSRARVSRRLDGFNVGSRRATRRDPTTYSDRIDEEQACVGRCIRERRMIRLGRWRGVFMSRRIRARHRRITTMALRDALSPSLDRRARASTSTTTVGCTPAGLLPLSPRCIQPAAKLNSCTAASLLPSSLTPLPDSCLGYFISPRVYTPAERLERVAANDDRIEIEIFGKSLANIARGPVISLLMELLVRATQRLYQQIFLFFFYLFWIWS